jgi:[glutamine synthetase] adenylyltransferase / [glutamine synthetase]-adenylyl-L-tyrosine phosphorylase
MSSKETADNKALAASRLARYVKGVSPFQSAVLPPAQKKKIAELIKRSPSPALARAHFLSLIEAGGLNSLRRLSAPQLSLLIRVLGASSYLSDILIRQGKGWPALFLRQIGVPRRSVAEHLADLALNESNSLDDLCTALRQHKQREYLRIGARDLLPTGTMEETVRELSALAEACLEAAYRFCRAEVEKDFGKLLLPGKQDENRFVILGMGKLGGGELNFSSDIDVIFLYESDEGESSGGLKGKTTPREFFTKIAKKIIQAMGQVTEDGFVFRIDLRLRPMGASGPLVQSVGSAMVYYESWGQCWERSALRRLPERDRTVHLPPLSRLHNRGRATAHEAAD